jgi:peptidoglycan hydrolase FlgJ
MTVGFPGLTPDLTQQAAPKSKLEGAAKQFEALIMQEVLKASRGSSDGGWLGTGDDQTGSMAVEMAEQQFAQALTTGRGLGLAKFVTAHLNRNNVTVANSGPANSPPLSPASTEPAK